MSVQRSASQTEESSRKLHIARELLSSERSYNHALRLLNDAYRLGLLRQKIIPSASVEKIFGPLVDLLRVSDTLVAQLDDCDGSVLESSETMIKIAPFFTMFLPYVKQYNETLRTVKQLLTSNNKFRDFCDSVRQDPRAKGLDLNSLLIMPIQRVPRYELLLRELQRAVEVHEPEWPYIERARVLVHNISERINSAMEIRDNEENMRAAQKYTGLSVVEPHRQFVAEGLLRKLAPADTEDLDSVVASSPAAVPCYVWLFSDMIVIRDGNPGRKKHSRPSKLRKATSIPVQVLPLRSMTVSAVQPEYMANTFKLTTPDQVVVLQCDRAHQLPEWTDDIARCIMILRGLPLKFEAKQVILARRNQRLAQGRGLPPGWRAVSVGRDADDIAYYHLYSGQFSRMSPAHFEWSSADAHPAEDTTYPRQLQQSSDVTETPPNELIVARGGEYTVNAWPSQQGQSEYLTPSEQGSLDSGSEWSWPDDSEEADSIGDQGAAISRKACKVDSETTTFAVAQWISSLAGRRMGKQGMTKAVGSVPQVQQRKPSSQPHFLNSVPQGAREFQKSVRRRLSQMLHKPSRLDDEEEPPPASPELSRAERVARLCARRQSQAGGGRQLHSIAEPRSTVEPAIRRQSHSQTGRALLRSIAQS